MKKLLGYTLAALLSVCGFLVSCSDNKEAGKSAIEKKTDETANQMVNEIRTPMDKALKLKSQGEERVDDMEKTINQ